MKIVVLGGTGGIGVEIIRQSIDHGHAVTALVRSPGPLITFSDRINLVQGDVLNRAELERVLAGQDAVVSGFGPRVPISKDDAHLLQHFGTALTSAMQRGGPAARGGIGGVPFQRLDHPTGVPCRPPFLQRPGSRCSRNGGCHRKERA